MLNLLDNAAKWSPPGGTVRVQMRPLDDWSVRARGGRRRAGHRRGGPAAGVRPLLPRRRRRARCPARGSGWRSSGRSRSGTAARCGPDGRRRAARCSRCGCPGAAVRLTRSGSGRMPPAASLRLGLVQRPLQRDHDGDGHGERHLRTRCGRRRAGRAGDAVPDADGHAPREPAGQAPAPDRGQPSATATARRPRPAVAGPRRRPGPSTERRRAGPVVRRCPRHARGRAIGARPGGSGWARPDRRPVGGPARPGAVVRPAPGRVRGARPAGPHPYPGRQPCVRPAAARRVLPATARPAADRPAGLAVGSRWSRRCSAGVLGGAVGHSLAGSGRGGSIGVLGQPLPEVDEAAAPTGPVEAVAERVLPSVVQLQVEGRRPAGEGSGMVLSADGLLLTNNHVVEAAADGGTVTAVFQRRHARRPRAIVGRDPSSDLAVIRAQNVSGLHPGRAGQLRLRPGRPAGRRVRVPARARRHRHHRASSARVDRAVSVGAETGANDADRAQRPADRRRDQPGQLGRAAGRHAGPGRRHQLRDRHHRGAGRLDRRRLLDPGQPGPAGRRGARAHRRARRAPSSA